MSLGVECSLEDNNGFDHCDSEEEDKALLKEPESEWSIWHCIKECLGCFTGEDS